MVDPWQHYQADAARDPFLLSLIMIPVAVY